MGTRLMALHIQLAETEATCIWKVSLQIVVEISKVCVMSKRQFL